MPVPELLQRLLTAPGPSGQEALPAQVWREAAASFGEVAGNVLGSSWVRVPGSSGGPLLAVVGHIDEIGVVVTHAGDDGLLAVRGLGGWDPHVLLGQRVEILTREGPLPAVVSARREKRKPGSDRKPVSFDDLFLDIGARDGEEARSLVRPGDAPSSPDRRSSCATAASPRALSTTGSARTSRSRSPVARPRPARPETSPRSPSSRRRSATSPARGRARGSSSPPSRSRST